MSILVHKVHTKLSSKSAKLSFEKRLSENINKAKLRFHIVKHYVLLYHMVSNDMIISLQYTLS